MKREKQSFYCTFAAPTLQVNTRLPNPAHPIPSIHPPMSVSPGVSAPGPWGECNPSRSGCSQPIELPWARGKKRAACIPTSPRQSSKTLGLKTAFSLFQGQGGPPQEKLADSDRNTPFGSLPRRGDTRATDSRRSAPSRPMRGIVSYSCPTDSVPAWGLFSSH